MIATLIAEAVAFEMTNLRNLADGGNFTDAELCRWLRKTLNKTSKELTVEIKRLESLHCESCECIGYVDAGNEYEAICRCGDRPIAHRQ